MDLHAALLLASYLGIALFLAAPLAELRRRP